MTWRDRQEGQQCVVCDGKRWPLLTVRTWHPPRLDPYRPEVTHPAFTSVRAKCIDRKSCIARVAKRQDRASVRSSKIFLTSRPGNDADCAQQGHCEWCGQPMWWTNKAGETKLDLRRSYHRAERGERDCRHEVNGSYAYGARNALLAATRAKARQNGYAELRCEDCHCLCELLLYAPDAPVPSRWFMRQTEATFEYWEADHEIELEDGGAHSLANLRCRCGPCHRAKTTRSAAKRREPKQPADAAQLALL